MQAALPRVVWGDLNRGPSIAPGPMPAGSPELMTMSGAVSVTALTAVPTACVARAFQLAANIDERLIAQAAYPQLALFLGLCGAYLPPAILALDLVRRVVRAALEDFDQVNAEARYDRLAELFQW